MKRRLSLRREHLTELSTSDLEAVAGAGYDTKSLICLTGVYPTINYDCTELVTPVTTAIGQSVDIC